VVSAVLVPRSFVVVTLQRRQQHGGISGAVENVLIDVVGFGDERLHGENGEAFLADQVLDQARLMAKNSCEPCGSAVSNGTEWRCSHSTAVVLASLGGFTARRRAWREAAIRNAAARTAIRFGSACVPHVPSPARRLSSGRPTI